MLRDGLVKVGTLGNIGSPSQGFAFALAETTLCFLRSARPGADCAYLAWCNGYPSSICWRIIGGRVTGADVWLDLLNAGDLRSHLRKSSPDTLNHPPSSSQSEA